MLTIKNLYSYCESEENCVDGLINAGNHKRSRRDVKWAFMNVNRVIEKQQKILLDDYYRFPINEPKFISNRVLKKNRWVVRPHFINFQVFQHVIMNCVKEDMLKTIYKYSCGSLPKRGALYGRNYIEKRIRLELRNSKILYALKFDIQKFFESIPIDKLETKLANRYRDEKFLLQFHKILQANILYCEGEYVKVGLPIGFYTSQWLANWYLSDLDNYIKHILKIKTYVRYMDDMLIISSNKEELQKQFQLILNYIHEVKGLEVKSNYQIFKFTDVVENKLITVRPIDFLGYKFHHNKVTLRKCILKAVRRKAVHIHKKSKITYHDAQSMLSYLGYFKHSDCELFYNRYIRPYINPEVLKEIVSKHQKKINKKHVSR